ncbi:hypothetical protein BC937DRAFT_90416 [Endogone sp. FLAS-F59071]|nr:hypothetical protein BC937DRAFT_90416 [Endogone sp. FLAS-F59071]|eukprot:RUS17102.1 hypothetical protein BC937DRAFT_90416 [Endogone sp. FLAS-F59071]
MSSSHVLEKFGEDDFLWRRCDKLLKAMRFLENPLFTYVRTTNIFRIHKTARHHSVRLWPVPPEYLPRYIFCLSNRIIGFLVLHLAYYVRPSPFQRDPKSYLSIDESDDEYTISHSTVLNAPPSNPDLELAMDFLPPPEPEAADQEANFRAEAKALGSRHAREQTCTKRPFDVVDAPEEEGNKKTKMNDDRERMEEEEEADAESNWVERQWYAEQTTAALNAFLEVLGYHTQAGPKGYENYCCVAFVTQKSDEEKPHGLVRGAERGIYYEGDSEEVCRQAPLLKKLIFGFCSFIFAAHRDWYYSNLLNNW